jgi:hypothetical protein
MAPQRRCASGYALGYSGIDGKRPISEAHRWHEIGDSKGYAKGGCRRARIAEAWRGRANAAALEASSVRRLGLIRLMMRSVTVVMRSVIMVRSVLVPAWLARYDRKRRTAESSGRQA